MLQGWIDKLEPAEPAEMALVERAAIADWRLNRCVRAERARLSTRVRHAATRHDLERFKRAEELGHQLVYDPLNRCMSPPSDPETLRKLLIWRRINPAVVVRELEDFSEGVDWMINRWDRLRGILGREAFWHYSEKFEAIKLLGHRPDDALNVEIVGQIMMACRVIHPEPWDVTADIQQAALGCEGRPIYSYRSETLEDRRPKSVEDAFNFLCKIIEDEGVRLRGLKKKLDIIAAEDRLEAEERAMFDDSEEAVLALRYESARDRELRRGLTDLLKKRKEEDLAEKRHAKELETEPEVIAEKEVVSKVPTRRTAPPNEANDDKNELSPKPREGRNSARKPEKSSPRRST